MTFDKTKDHARIAHLGEIDHFHKLMDKCRANKKGKAFTDAKKHYDKLLNQLKIYDKAMGYDK